MSSTFNGLEVAKRALHTQQSALYTTGHNIANANTEGYTRQRVNMTQTAPYPPASRNRPEIPGQVGSGVEAGSIERIRDSFIDKQFRQENTKVGYYESKADMMSKMETILNEPSEQGLSHSMDQFWQSLQDLSVNPEDSGARSVVKERGVAVADAFHYIDSSLKDVKVNFKNEIDVNNTEVNSLIDQINGLNEQISDIEPHGFVPNDLYDERDRLVDSLSEYVDINVSYDKSSGQPSPIAQGIATVEIKSEGPSDGVKLVDGNTGAVNHIDFSFNENNNATQIEFSGGAAGTTVPADEFVVNGKLKAMMEGAGYVDGAGDPAGEYNDMLADLDEMADNFIKEFNNVHENGYTLVDSDSDGNGDQGGAFFTGNSASDIDIAASIKTNVDNIAASDLGPPGDGENAVELSDVYTRLGENYNTATTMNDKTSIKSFFEGVIGEMGVSAEDANRMQNNSEILRQQVEGTKQSISSVSLDEEMTNMIQYQHAYNAAARNMTAVDEMLDRIINNMGLVGR
ncbi:flagellar hook-associated protein 1 FlgK [Gracilibacillus orientalis]|uniref:Flagellar hook-associated protein 1 n=1 Tax=Gracilibacillus orientalis TaxID=334253 RepID=A0A1I4P860_9BACI|nr:flagellar hook-associated protein FlgK [Gracilibacillus orientalis]SFM23780.1 flagellar hook-associated protein 1 FlgK [Gracilibacillus orientalis]